MGPGGCNDCLAPAYGYVAVRCAAIAGAGERQLSGSSTQCRSVAVRTLRFRAHCGNCGDLIWYRIAKVLD